MSETDPLAEALDHESAETVELRRKVFELERKLVAQGDTTKRIKDIEQDKIKLLKELEVHASFTTRSAPPGWIKKKPRSKSKHHAIANLMLSDLHLDEVVYPEQVMGMNAYNRDIALQRLDRTTTGFIDVTKNYWTNLTYDGAIVYLGGDIFSGDIHEELKETNHGPMLASVDFWIDPLSDAIGMIADEFGKVHVPVVPGNHGRTTRKPRAKFRAESNFDWFVGCQLARLFKDDSRVTFDLSKSADCLVPVYDSMIMLTHGDQATGGNGIGGIWPPLMRLDARKRQRQEAVEQGYDLMVMGHWHQLTYGPSFIVNGAMKGYDEYAFTQNFGYELPSQAAWLMTPEHGKTWTAPIYSMNRKKEGW